MNYVLCGFLFASIVVHIAVVRVLIVAINRIMLLEIALQRLSEHK
jgi:hypothetical protein